MVLVEGIGHPLPEGGGQPPDMVYEIAGLDIRKGAGGRGDFLLRVGRLVVGRGERLAFVGPSGSGKTTLIDVLAFMARPCGLGRFLFRPHSEKRDLSRVLLRGGDSVLAGLRRRHIGYVPQVGGLLPYLTVRSNVALPRQMLGMPADGTLDLLLEYLGLSRHADKKPGKLSVGERQRVAIARALAHRPAVVIADEPTAALDPHHSDQVMRLFVQLAETLGTTMIVVSHDRDRVKRFGLRLVEHRVHIAETGETIATLAEADR